MKIGNWKLWTAAIPLVAGVGLFVVLGGLSSFRSSAGKTTPKTSVSSTVAPQDPTHEKAALEEELKRKPDHAPILLRLAELERDAGHHKEAAGYLRKALETDATNVEARLELSRSLYESGDVDGALAETKRLLADHPNQVDGLYNLGAIYANRSQFDQARQYWAQAVAADPKAESAQRAKDGLAKIGK